MPPQDKATDPHADTSKVPDPKSFLLPKKEGAPSVDSAQRVNAGALLEQEERAKQGAPAEPVQPASPPQVQPAQPAPAPKETTSVQALETYTSDITSVIQAGGVSAVSIAAAEAGRRGRGEGDAAAQSAEAPAPRRHWVLIIAGCILVLGGLGIVASLVLSPKPAPFTQGPAAPLLSVDQTIAVSLPASANRDALMASLNSAREGVTLSLGLMARLFVDIPTTTGQIPDQVPVQQLFSILTPNMPASLLRTLLPTYLLGVHSFDENQSFLVLRVDSYQQAYSGMLQWEDTMQQDLSPLFARHPAPHIHDAPAAVATTTATTTASTTPIQPDGFATVFVDRVVENHDARVVQNQDGDILLLWTFLDRNTVAVTTNEYTLREIIGRLNTASLVPHP